MAMYCSGGGHYVSMCVCNEAAQLWKGQMKRSVRHRFFIRVQISFIIGPPSHRDACRFCRCAANLYIFMRAMQLPTIIYYIDL